MLTVAVAGCTLLGPAAPPPASLFKLTLFTLTPAQDAATPRALGAGFEERTIEIAPPAARPGFDGPRMAYVTRPYEIQFFARHEWVEPPAKMLAPLLREALERDGRFQATASGTRVTPALQLETEIVALEHEFTVKPSQVRFALQARLLDGAAHRVVAAGAFEAVEPSPSEDPYGGVIAANRAVARVLDELVEWCARSPGP